MSDGTARYPEPAREGHLRVSDRERDATIDLLAEAATDGRLTLDEYSDRADKALTSQTRDDLAVLTYDLATVRAASAPPAYPSADPTRIPAEKVVAVFSSETRRGRWPVPARLGTMALFGECKIEMQDASLHSRVTVIEANAVFGSIEIVVPDGVEVRMTGMSVFGARTSKVQPGFAPGAPVVEVRGKAVFGEITVRQPGWKEGVRKVINEHLDRRRS